MNNKLNRCWLVGAMFGLSACGFSSWKAIRLDEQAIVSLPTPCIESPLLASAKLLSSSDTQGYYLVKVSPLEAAALGLQRQQYYQAELHTMLAQSQGQLLDSAAFTVNGYQGLEFALKGTRVVGRTKTPVFIRCRYLLVGKKVYSLQFLPRAGAQDSLSLPKTFFASFTLNGHSTD